MTTATLTADALLARGRTAGAETDRKTVLRSPHPALPSPPASGTGDAPGRGDSFATEEKLGAMITPEGSWGMTLLVALGILVVLGVTLAFLVRSLGTRSLSVYCPVTRHMVVVQYAVDEFGQLTDVVRCSTFPDAEITCGLPCLTGGARALVPERPHADLLNE
jgi:hypothetical protein